jgi:hypothetical protein
MEHVTYGRAGRRPVQGWTGAAWRRLVTGIVVACAALLIVAGGALAKSGSVPIDPPSPTTVVFTLSLADQSYDYTWADVSGSGRLGTKITQSYLKEPPQDWAGVWLRTVVADAERRSGIALDDDWKLKVTAVDGYVSSLFVCDVKDPDNNYLLAMDPVQGCTTEDPNDPTAVWYDPTYVRICTNGDYGNTAFPARLVPTSDSMRVLDAGGRPIPAPVTAGLVVTSPTASQSRANVVRGTKLALRAVATKAAGATQAQPVVWTTGDRKVATVAANGTVSARSAGAAVVKATSGSFVVSFRVTVVAKKRNATRVTIAKTKAVVAGKTTRLVARLFPSSATSTISWKSSNTGIVKVDRGGLLSGVRKGRATVTVRTSNGKTARCTVTVK